MIKLLNKPWWPFSNSMGYLASTFWSVITFIKKKKTQKINKSYKLIYSWYMSATVAPVKAKQRHFSPPAVPVRKNDCHDCFHVKINFSQPSGGVHSCAKFPGRPILSSSVPATHHLKRCLPVLLLRGMRVYLLSEAQSFNRWFRNTFLPSQRRNRSGFLWKPVSNWSLAVNTTEVHSKWSYLDKTRAQIFSFRWFRRE